MELEFRRVEVATELRRLREFDKRVFSKGDLFPSAYWRECDVYWMLVDGKRVGCCALQDGEEGELWITSSGILPAWQGMGLGRVMKAWQVALARGHGYRRVLTETRAGNTRMIHLNESFGFRIIKMLPDNYVDPDEDGVEMELVISPA
jgi:ribosomal protein S18 acetylase RimI-like enzyme